MTKSQGRAYREWLKEVKRLYKIMYGRDAYISYKDSAMVEFWFEHGYTEGKACELMGSYNIY